jgi:hypothetical protein
MEREDLIRVRAYDIWVAEGCPEGRERDHWERAASEIDASIAAGSENSETKTVTADPAPPPAEETSPMPARSVRRAA